jgi:uroporphyrinogen-III synthase
MQVYKRVWVPKSLNSSQKNWATNLGFDVVECPVLNYAPSFESHQVRATLLQTHHWLFSSARAIYFLKDLLLEMSPSHHTTIYAVGAKTAAALAALGHHTEKTAPNAAAILPFLQGLKAPIAYFCNAESTSFLELKTNLLRVPVYEGTPVVGRFQAQLPDAVFGLSPNTLEALYALHPELVSVPVVAIGPTTAAYLLARGIAPLAVCATPSVEACFEELLKRNEDVFEK